MRKLIRLRFYASTPFLILEEVKMNIYLIITLTIHPTETQSEPLLLKPGIILNHVDQ